MTTTIDQAGRLVITSEIRRQAALEPGTPLDVRCRDGVIEIEPSPVSVTFERKGRLLVAKRVGKLVKLRGATVEQTRQHLRTRRIDR